jgi:hypothetical protein
MASGIEGAFGWGEALLSSAVFVSAATVEFCGGSSGMTGFGTGTTTVASSGTHAGTRRQKDHSSILGSKS